MTRLHAPSLYPTIQPFDQRMINVGQGHDLYVEQSGNPNGIPVVVLHGGPGGGSSPYMRRFFDPQVFRIVLFDQRGCGRSTPFASVENNTSWDLVEDIQIIRRELEIDAWHLFGGSWGATLALLSAQTHPDHALSLILRGVFTMTRAELDWFYRGGPEQFYPEVWARLISILSPEERQDVIAAYHRRLFEGSRPEQIEAAEIWTAYEQSLATSSSLGTSGRIPESYALAFARIEAHYFHNLGFLPSDNHIMSRLDQIAHLPCQIVQGRLDLVCPPVTAERLARALPKAHLTMVPGAGHALSEPGIQRHLVQCMDKIARDAT